MDALCLRKICRKNFRLPQFNRRSDARKDNEFYRFLAHKRKHGVLGEIDVSLDEIPHFDKDPEYKKNLLQKLMTINAIVI